MTALLDFVTPAEAQANVARLARKAREDRGHSREKAALLTGIPVSTLRVFERNGNISFRQFLAFCDTYGDLGAVGSLFPERRTRALDELLKMQTDGYL